MTVYRRSPSALHRTAGPDVEVMMPGDDEIHVLSGAASAMWDLLGDELTIDDVIATLADAYAMSPTDIGPDVRRCLDDLAERRLVEPASA